MRGQREFNIYWIDGFQTFIPGQRVKCLSVKSLGGWLKVGEIYTVKQSWDDNGDEMVALEGYPGDSVNLVGWYSSRFEPA